MNVPVPHGLHSWPPVSFWNDPGLHEEQKAELFLFLVEYPDGHSTHDTTGLNSKVERKFHLTLENSYGVLLWCTAVDVGKKEKINTKIIFTFS